MHPVFCPNIHSSASLYAQGVKLLILLEGFKSIAQSFTCFIYVPLVAASLGRVEASIWLVCAKLATLPARSYSHPTKILYLGYEEWRENMQICINLFEVFAELQYNYRFTTVVFKFLSRTSHNTVIPIAYDVKRCKVIYNRGRWYPAKSDRFPMSS